MSNRSIFYGWWVVAAFSVTTFISTGIRHAVGPFLKPMVADLHLDRASFSLVIGVTLFLCGVFIPFAGASMTGMSLLVPAVTWLILTTGWRLTYVVIAAGVLLLVLPLCLLVVRDSPESMGLTADGAAVKAGASAPPVERVTAGEALQTLAFWQLAGSFFTCGFSMSLPPAHGMPMLTDHGYSPMFASWALGVLGGSSIGFTVMLGALSDRFGRRPVLAAIYAGRILTFAGFFLIRDNPTALLPVAVPRRTPLA